MRRAITVSTILLLISVTPALCQVGDLRSVPDKDLRHWMSVGASIEVPSDGARYTLVDFSPTTDQTVLITTKREGPSGISYSRRLIDCRAERFSYVGEGDTLEELKDNEKRRAMNPDPMGTYVDRSISWYVARASCLELSVVLEKRRRSLSM